MTAKQVCATKLAVVKRTLAKKYESLGAVETSHGRRRGTAWQRSSIARRTTRPEKLREWLSMNNFVF